MHVILLLHITVSSMALILYSVYTHSLKGISIVQNQVSSI